MAFWRGRRVLITGHTGFKGAWLTSWLREAGAEVFGLSLDPPTNPNIFDVARVSDGIHDTRGDIRQAGVVERAFETAAPDIVFHLAAQSLVRPSYAHPVATYATNVMGTVHVLDALRRSPATRAAVIVTSDKCYENREWVWGYRESDPMGGHDPYSSSKGCAELVTAAYRRSYFDDARIGIATVRAGNVIGGGDWAPDRLVPDAFEAFASRRALLVRNPGAVRPWQHVLDPVAGYLLLAERLSTAPREFSGGWNFGPDDTSAVPVSTLLEKLATEWGSGARWESDSRSHPHEARMLKLDTSKARHRLGWQPRLHLDAAIEWTVKWRRTWMSGRDMRQMTVEQVSAFQNLGAPAAVGAGS